MYAAKIVPTATIHGKTATGGSYEATGFEYIALLGYSNYFIVLHPPGNKNSSVHDMGIPLTNQGHRAFHRFQLNNV